MRPELFIVFLLAISACGKSDRNRQVLKLDRDGEVTVLVTGAQNEEEIRKEAAAAGIEVSGGAILQLKGHTDQLQQLSFVASENFDYVIDSEFDVERPEAFSVTSEGVYQAKKEFGTLEFWTARPEADGRGVKVGVIDDGISPHQAGFITTSTGERKFLKKNSPSSFTTFKLEETEGGLSAVVKEERPVFGTAPDLNGSGKLDEWKIFVPAGEEKVCLDLNNDGNFEGECVGSFSRTGEYLPTIDKRLVLMTELDLTAKTVRLFQPERDGDSHGEGVASVLAGYALGNIRGFDGVAPGAQILDYDLSELSDKAEERQYTIGTFLKAIDWLGSEGVEVANVSYSLFFTSAKSQEFMQKAIDALVKKYNMVVSFSAGNNGPGLGSLNRRAIYPSSVLVAGAYISPELDERVHGVTGLPEEGRVVYYSSRGPGLGTGPVLISPLSSLTASTPTETYRAFSGTSSASPALAGAAAVLISAIKQEGLKVHASTVVHALRLSGKRLTNEPYIFQGHGLPQLTRALDIYRMLLNGEEFEEVRVAIDRGAVDGVNQSGIFLRKSELNGLTTRVVRLTGVPSAAAAADKTVSLLSPVKLVMSQGLSGPRELWVSSGTSQFGIDINADEMLNGKLESFGEIQVISSRTGMLLASVPVTIVDDLDVRSNPRQTLSLGAQEGLRIPLRVSQGVKAFRIRAQVISGDDRSILLSAFNNHQIRTVQQRLGNDIIVPTPSAGFYQVGVSIGGGTARGARVEIQIDEIRINLRTTITEAKSPQVRIENSGAQGSYNVKLVREDRPMFRKIFTSDKIAEDSRIEQRLEEGTYQVSIRPTQQYDLAYFSSSCTVALKAADGSVSLAAATSFTVPKEGRDAVVRCIPFDEGATFTETYRWDLSLSKNTEGQTVRFDIGRNTAKNVEFTQAEPGPYTIRLSDPVSGTEFDLGEVELI